MRTRLTIDLAPDQKERLSRLAHQKKVSVRQLVIESLEERLRAAEGETGDLPSLVGSLSGYARTGLWSQEASAWEDSVAEPGPH